MCEWNLMSSNKPAPMTFLGQQTQIGKNKAGVLNMVRTKIFPTFYVTNTLHL